MVAQVEPHQRLAPGVGAFIDRPRLLASRAVDSAPTRLGWLTPAHLWPASLMLALIIPLPTPIGRIYLAEPAIYLAMLLVFARSPNLRLPVHAVAAVVLAVIATADLVTGVGAAPSLAQAQVRAAALFAGTVLVLWNAPGLAVRIVSALPAFALGVTMMCAIEALGLYVWLPENSIGYVGDRVRVLGPLQPGPTAMLLLPALYLALRSRRLGWSGACLTGILITGSRAHLLGAVVFFAVAFRPQKFDRRSIGAMLIAVAVGVSTPIGLARIVGALTGDRGGRLEIWRAGIAELTLWGKGPGGFIFDRPAGGTITYTHNQYLTPVVNYGLIGLIVTIALVGSALRMCSRRHMLPLFAGSAVAAMFGEFLFGASVAGAIGAVPLWAILAVPVQGLSVASRRLPGRRHELHSDV